MEDVVSYGTGACSPMAKHALVTGILALLTIGSMARAEAATAAPLDLAYDTARVSPFAFQKTVLFTPEYLLRAAEAASIRRVAAADIPIEITLPRPGGTASTFARRYGISGDLAQKIVEVALAEGVDPELAFRLIRVESRFVVNARGPGGSLGLAQLMPGTARSLDRSLRTDAQIIDPQTNLRLGFRYLRRMIDQFGDVRLGLLAYNRGPVAVDRALKSGRNPENGYSVKVLGSNGRRPYTGPGVVPKPQR